MKRKKQKTPLPRVESKQEKEAPATGPPPRLRGRERINKILSAAGVASRRRADELMAEGRVSLNGVVIKGPGAAAVWGKDSIEVDGEEIPAPSHRVYLMLNKPFGYISALHDPRGRPVISDLVSGLGERVYPVGRLDFDSLGLLLLTNDGEWAFRMTHPKYRVPRTYKITAEGEISEIALSRLRSGLELDDGPSGPARVKVLKRDQGRTVLRITVYQGRSRIVRRMMEAVGHPVIQLIRIGFGPLALGRLKVGEYRHLSQEEIRKAARIVGLA
ncbi:MAG: pseudouridine synthase [Desulfobacteraceae bacterium]